MPTEMKPGEKYMRGCFIVFLPGGYASNDSERRREIPFRFNPETLSRSLQIEQAAPALAPEGKGRRSPGSSSTEQGADASSGALKETLSVLIRLDFIEREGPDGGGDREANRLGLLPEIAALESLMHPLPPPASSATAATAARPERPTVLLAWGVERVFPVRLVSMTINETMHNAELAPLRAEIEVGLEVTRGADARSNLAVKEALEFGDKRRKVFSDRFHRFASKQTTYFPDITGKGK